MERTVPSTASDEIELYLRTIYSLLRSTTEVQIRTLEEVHAGMNSSMHADARKESPDTSAFIYSLLRIPDCMADVRLVVMGQSFSVFAKNGYAHISEWEPVSARARRRRCSFDGKDTLACFIASRSDIDDLIPVLVAYQIEWNKLNFLLQRCPPELLTRDVETNGAAFNRLAEALEMPQEDLERLWALWGEDLIPNLQTIASSIKDVSILNLSGSLSDYWRATRTWWNAIENACPHLTNRPVYFVSSNTHSLVNTLAGFALQHEATLVRYLERKENARLRDEWQAIQNKQVLSSRENFLYYLFKKYLNSEEGAKLGPAMLRHEQKHGITRVLNANTFEIEAQVFDLNRLDPAVMDPRLLEGENNIDPDKMREILQRSDALIVNIDYPLGLAAYNILAKVAENAGSVLGVYILGKAATLNAVRGDVMIPNVVQDEHSLNTYLFQNCFAAANVVPYLAYGSVLDNQKAVTVLGTFLQNARVMDVIYREGYTDIEMEAGPYLSAIYEMYRPQRHPRNELVNLYGVPFDIGVMHYASDTPLSKGKNLGAGTLSYSGMNSTYAGTVAIVRRILRREIARLQGL
jgi:hypothetical protein